MSNLVPSVLNLDKGLNLQTAKMVAPAGSVFDTVNYEQVDFQGHKRIDGYARYDGSLIPALDEYYAITASTDISLVEAGALVFTADDTLFGVVVGVTDTVVYVAIINQNIHPVNGDVLTVRLYTDGVPAGTFFTVDSSEYGVDSGVIPQEHYVNLLNFTAALRARVESLPGGIIGLQWFRDRLYAVADVTAVVLSGDTPIIYPNDILELPSGETSKVLDAYVVDTDRVVLLDTLNTASWAVPGTVVDRDGIPVGTISSLLIANAAEQKASFFESRSEQQVLEEDGPSGPYDFGWRFVDQGWLVNFEAGLSAFGSFPSLNQNISGLGIQGPTSTTGNNGRPLQLLQKVVINGKPVQVNGWKSSQTPTSYQLDPDNLIDVDTDFIYGDAYVSWNGTTGAVSAPGYTTSALPEYPATNTVEVAL